MKNDVQIALRLPYDLMNKIDEAAVRLSATTGISVTRSDVIRRCLGVTLANEEDFYSDRRKKRKA